MKKAALAVAAAIVVSASIFSALQVRSVSQRVAALEQSQATLRTSGTAALPTSRPTPRVEPPDGSSHAIVAVVDGDTAKIEFQGETISMRIIGIDTPETVHPSRPVEPFGPEATVRARELLEGKTVKLEYDADPEHDRFGKYGRLLVYLRLEDGTDFGKLMVADGFARAYPKYPFSRSEAYLAVEAVAKKMKKGLWGLEPAVPMAAVR
jgi:endonuclease YncB( thermonuclease family)